MNKKQFEIWEKQKRREFEIALNKLRDGYAACGLASSGIRNKAEEDLKARYESEIDIVRLGLEDDKNKGHVAVKMLKSATNNVFINSQIHGQLNLAGNGNSFIKTKINPLKQNHPFWFWIGAVASIIGIITGIIFLIQLFDSSFDFKDIKVEVPTHINPSVLATSTPNIANILSKNNKLETLYEKQSFLKDYIGKNVYGVGAYVDFYRSGETFMLLVNVYGNWLACILADKSESLGQKLLLFKKGQNVTFTGLFSNSSLNGSAYRTIDHCSILD